CGLWLHLVEGGDRTTIRNKTVSQCFNSITRYGAVRAMKVVVFVVFLLAWGRSGDAQRRCRRAFPRNGQRDCGTLTETCSLNSVFGFDLNSVTFPAENHYVCYRTCYENGINGNCIATERFDETPIELYASSPMYTAMKFSSPRYRRRSGAIGDYRNSNICRYHVRCSGTKRLYYSIPGQSMQDTATCNGMPNVCVDRIKMIFPGVGQCDRCSSKNSQINMNCMDRSGLGNELMVEFTSNRESDFTGFEMLVNCVEPGFDQNNIPPPDNKRKRQVQEECASPMGIGPRPFPELPPPAPRIQRVLDRDNTSLYIVLTDSEDRVTYNNNTLTVQLANQTENTIYSISVLEVESPLDLRRYFRIAPGVFSGFTQLVVSGDSAVMVQFGVDPRLLPSEEEAVIASLLDGEIAEAVAGLGQFDVLDELDLLEQAFEFTAAPNTTDSDSGSEREKRGIEPGFVEALAMEYGNACNGVLRTSACIYQQVVLGRDCEQI
ncbi:hypothetical protein GBAR_LOCUS22633, partial [Geodia barretti]